MPDRRTFLISFSGVVAAPVFAKLALPPMARREMQWTAGDMAASTAPTASSAKIALRIDGWESPADSESDTWVRINSSWRATWR